MKKRAFVRYSKKGKIVPGSLILTSGTYPNGPSTWKEVPADLCCDSGIKLILETPSLPITTPYIQFYCGMGPTLVAGAIAGTYRSEQDLVYGLNTQLGYMGVFSLNSDSNIVLNISKEIADILLKNPLCDSINLSGSITSF